MKTEWPKVKLTEVLRNRKEFVTIDDLTTYKRPRVQLHAKGIVLRDEVPGALIKTKKQQVCQSGELLVAEIDAKVGGFGIVPEFLDRTIVSSHYFLFSIDESKLNRRYLDFFIRTPAFFDQIKAQGSTNYAAIRPSEVLDYEIPLPPLTEQRRIVARIEELAAQINEARTFQKQAEIEEQRMLASAFVSITGGVKRQSLGDVAPIIRRSVKIEATTDYRELGIRSFGKGTFHKPPINGLSLGTKRLFQIYPGDLVFNNVFAWEGAVAVAQPEDDERFGSHRFITCAPKAGICTSNFLCFFFLTKEGLSLLGEGSPGGAGRNRTLGVEALMRIPVPLPEYRAQIWFDNLQAEVSSLKRVHTETTAELDALIPSILDKAFKGEL